MEGARGHRHTAEAWFWVQKPSFVLFKGIFVGLEGKGAIGCCTIRPERVVTLGFMVVLVAADGFGFVAVCAGFFLGTNFFDLTAVFFFASGLATLLLGTTVLFDELDSALPSTFINDMRPSLTSSFRSVTIFFNVRLIISEFL